MLCFTTQTGFVYGVSSETLRSTFSLAKKNFAPMKWNVNKKIKSQTKKSTDFAFYWLRTFWRIWAFWSIWNDTLLMNYHGKKCDFSLCQWGLFLHFLSQFFWLKECVSFNFGICVKLESNVMLIVVTFKFFNTCYAFFPQISLIPNVSNILHLLLKASLITWIF